MQYNRNRLMIYLHGLNNYELVKTFVYGIDCNNCPFSKECQEQDKRVEKGLEEFLSCREFLYSLMEE